MLFKKNQSKSWRNLSKDLFFGLKNSETLKPKFKENLLVLTEVWFSWTLFKLKGTVRTADCKWFSNFACHCPNRNGNLLNRWLIIIFSYLRFLYQTDLLIIVAETTKEFVRINTI